MIIKNIKIRRYRKLKGRCYEIAFQFVLDNPEWLLIHGEIDVSSFLGKQYTNYKHAWAKKGNYIFDPAHNKIYSKDDWKKFKPIEIKVYSLKDAVLNIGMQKSHYGPWYD